jgi:hypothetical protein
VLSGSRSRYISQHYSGNLGAFAHQHGAMAGALNDTVDHLVGVAA